MADHGRSDVAQTQWPSGSQPLRRLQDTCLQEVPITICLGGKTAFCEYAALQYKSPDTRILQHNWLHTPFKEALPHEGIF